MVTSMTRSGLASVALIGRQEVEMEFRGKHRGRLLTLAVLVASLASASAALASARGPIREVELAADAHAVTLSADGNIALLAEEREGAGRVRVLARSNGVWAQQAIFGEQHGGRAQAVALSADGDIGLLGIPQSGWGLVDELIRAGTTWSAREAISSPEAQEFGWAESLGLSGNGNTVLVQGGSEGEGETSCQCAWLYRRAGSSWAVQTTFPSKEAVALSSDGSTALVGTTVLARQRSSWVPHELAGTFPPYARSPALSADGDTAFVGGVPFERHGSSWTRQELKLAPGTTADAHFGSSVAVSARGDVALVGDPPVEGELGGAAFVVRRKGSTWRQVGPKLTCEGCRRFGEHVALSANASTALISERP
jgi:hypothetical protein